MRILIQGLLLGYSMAGWAATPATPAAPVRWTPPAIASDQYESSPVFTPDGREVYFFRADPGFSNYRLLVSACVDGAWGRPAEPPFAAPLPASESDPFVSADGRELYYISTRDKTGNSAVDDFDIWRVRRQPGGQWGQPARVDGLNSPGSELLPRKLPDGRMLFGSDRAGGLGAGDIYIATPSGTGWRIENLGAPVNTAGPEYEADMSPDGKTLIVVADRGDKSHLHRYRRTGDQWIADGRIDARPDVFQVGPLFSPKGDRLLFSQADGARSGEWFVADLSPATDQRWPPSCEPR